MKLAQALYERGHITYMRTDSVNVSAQARAAAKSFVEGAFGPGYYPEQPNFFKSKGGAQEAHEAIRPTDVTLTPERVKKDLTAAGVEVFVPNEQERELVAKRIYEELEKGSVKESTLQEFQQLIRRMEDENGIEGVILGCTELPLLLNSGNCPVPCFDSVEIHLRKLVELVLEN